MRTQETTTCEELNALYLVLTDWALHKTPCIVEF